MIPILFRFLKQVPIVIFIVLGITFLKTFRILSLLGLKYLIKLKIKPEESVIVITGCDTGFGYLLSVFLTKKGFRIISGCLTEEGVVALQSTVDLALHCDVTKEIDIGTLVQATKTFLLQHPQCKIWAIINNAGIAPLGYVEWMSLQSFRRAMDVNYFGTVAVTKSFLSLLKKTRESRIINISSVAGVSPCGPFFGPYCGSKHAVEGVMKSLRHELKPWKIHVSNINPSTMRTPLISTSCENCLRDFRSSSSEIRDQYVESSILKYIKLAQMSLEDPNKVIQEVYEVITDVDPAFNNYVGYGSYILSATNYLPYWLVEILSSAIPTNIVKPEAIISVQGIQ